MTNPEAVQAALVAIARAAKRLSETIHQGQQMTLRTHAGDLGDLDRTLRRLAELDPAFWPQG